jgi:hypothetical protein
MKVILARDWFAPGGQRFRHLKNAVVEVPDDLAKFLPKDAVVVDGAVPAPVTTADLKGQPLSAADEERAALDAEQKRLEELEAREKAEAEAAAAKEPGRKRKQ